MKDWFLPDPLGDARLLRRLAPAAASIRRYFQVEVAGLDQVPEGAALLVGNHNAGIVIPDAYALASAWCEQTNYQDPLVFLAHDIGFRVPLIGKHLSRVGLLRASRQNALAALARGRKVVVYPGSELDSMRPSRERDRIVFGGRKGFVRLALEANVPIVPIVSAGAHDGWYVLTRGESIASALGLKRWLRIEAFPIAFALPFGIVMGPFTPHIPLPYKIRIEALPAIRLEGSRDDPNAVARGYETITIAMQRALTRMAAKLPRSL